MDYIYIYIKIKYVGGERVWLYTDALYRYFRQNL